MSLGPHNITVHRAALVKDAYQNTIQDWDNETSWTESGCSFQPGQGTEYVTDRSATETVAVVYLPIDARIDDDDEVSFAGSRYEIEGSIQVWEFGSPLDHKVVSLRKWSG